MTYKLSLYISIIIASLTFSSCEKKDPIIPNEEELITTVNYILSPSDGGADVILSFVDLDGDGGASPTISTATLAANQTYSARLELLNELETMVEDITEEIQEEDVDHQFFFQTDVANLTIEYSDEDSNGDPIGLLTSLTTGAAASGSITIILHHEPKKSAEGVSDGDITNSEGETDIEVTFPIDVQ